MKEHDFINLIKQQTNNELIGDDCAYLKDLGIVISQDNFVENIHFKQEWATPYQIGYKAAAVNISDILASGAKPEYLTVGLSIPNNIDETFLKEFYKGVQTGSYGAKIAGGDITAAERIFISITAIGSTLGRKISSRKNAKPGYVLITKGNYGESSKGLNELSKGIKTSFNIKTHLEPELDVEFSKSIASQITEDYAMMDTSDGLADALFQIAKASRVTINADYIDGMFGAEDYHLVAAVPETFLSKITDYKIIGQVEQFNSSTLIIDDKKYNKYEELKLYDHFRE